MISNDSLIQFLTIIESGSLTKAAEHLNVNPSSLSRAMKKLESEADVKLFQPQGRGLILTHAGKELYRYSKRNLDDLALFMKNLKGNKHSETLLRMATYEIFSTHFMAHLIHSHLPHHSLQVLEKAPQEIEASLLSYESDLGITYIPFAHPDLDHMRIMKTQMGVWARKGAFKNLSSNEIPFATPLTPLSLNIPGLDSLDGWPTHIPRNKKYAFQQLQSALETTKLGLSAVHVPDFLVHLINSHSLAEEKLENISERFPKYKKVILTIYLVKRREDEENQTMKKVAKALRMIMK